MTVKICDRCGKQMNTNPIMQSQNPLYSIAQIVPIGQKSIDLCEKCSIAFEEWVKVGDTDKVGDIKKYEKCAEPKWIPVSERLPKEFTNVIVTDIETNNTYQSQYIGKGYWDCDNGYFRNRIVAWMPLPKSYESQESEVSE